MSTTLYTIGFTQKSAEEFFGALNEINLTTLIDVRLSNQSQLAGFSKGRDLPFFIKEICKADYVHMPDWAPTKELMDSYKMKNGISRETFVNDFNALLESRAIERTVETLNLDRACLLCSEPTVEKCHRRLVTEYLARHLPDLSVTHI